MNLFSRYQYRKSKYRVSPIGIFKELMVSQYMEDEEKTAVLLSRYNNLVQKALCGSNYYSNIKHTKEKSDIKRIPELTKEIIFKNGESLYNQNYRGSKYLHKTSGSTGQPLSVYLSDEAEAYRIAGRWRFMAWWGIRPRDKGVLVWGGHKKNHLTFVDRLKQILLSRTLFIPVFNLSPDTIRDYYDVTKKHKAVFLRGYKSAVLQYARLAVEAGIDLSRLNLKVVITTSEVLLDDEREFISQAFGCKVANEYGAVEAGLFAYECPEGGLHIFEESVYFYTNEQHEIVSTELHNDCQILLNYKTGDRVFLKNERCKCGRTLGLIDYIEGRSGDTILKPNGEEISQYLFYYFFKELPAELASGVKQYKVIQKGNHFSVFIVKGDDRCSKVVDMLKKKMLSEIGSDINIVFDYVEVIPREKSGKIRFFKREQ